MSLRIVLSENLRALRKEKGLSQVELAKLAGLSNVYISEIERGESFPSDEVLNRLAAALETAPTELLFDNDLMLYRLKKLLKK